MTTPTDAPAPDDPPKTNAPKPRTKRAKVNQAETQRRINQTMKLLLSGLPVARIVQIISGPVDKGGWDVKERQAYHYMAQARELIKAEFDATRPALLAEHVMHRRDLRERAGRAGDMRTELAAAQDEAKLMGLYAPVASKVTMSWQDEAKELGLDPSLVENVARQIAEDSASDNPRHPRDEDDPTD